MNDIDLLKAYGPDASPVSSEALAAARARLRDEIAVPTRRERSWWPRLSLAALAATAVVVAVVVSLDPASSRFLPPTTANGPASSGPPQRPATPGPITLVASSGPSFPWTVTGLGRAVFTADPDGPTIAVYLADDRSDIYVSSTTATPDRELGLPRPTTVNGRSGWFVGLAGGRMSLAWESSPGRWVRVTGLGRFSNEAALRDLASRVRDEPQRIDMRYTVGLLPAGWELRGFKENGSVLTYVDPAAPGRDLTVSSLDRFTTDPAREIQDFEAVQRVKIRGRTVPLFRTRNSWLIELTLPGGTKAQLTASRALTADQVGAIAASVRRSNR